MILTNETETNTAFNINDLANSVWFYVILLAIAVLLLIIIVNNNRKKKLLGQIDEYQVRLNSLKSIPLPFKVTKALALARVNRDVADNFKLCQENFDTVQTNMKKIQEMIADSDELMQLKKYAQVNDNNRQIASLLDTTGKTVDELDSVLNSILEKEEIQRSKITELKDIYHNIKVKINNSPDKYLFCWEALDSRINGIDHQFSQFESIMASNDFDQADTKTEEIRQAVNDLDNVVESIPELIAVAKGEVPAIIEDVRNTYTLIKGQGAYLDHLDVLNNIGYINQSLQNDLNKIKLCDITEVNDDLLECETKLNQLKQQIEKEKESYADLLNLREVITRNVAQLNETVETMNKNYSELSSRYGIEQNGAGLQQANDRAAELSEQCHILLNSLQENNAPASKTLLSLSQLNTEVVVALNNVSKMNETVSNASNDEQSAREQLVKLSLVLNEMQARIRNNRIPNISSQYDNDINKAEEYIVRLESLLSETPINVTLVNSLKNQAVELIYQLHESVNRILGTAKAAENLIVIGNMYRSSYPEIDSELTRSELAYRNGEYTQALTIAVNTLHRLIPDTVEELLKSDKKGTLTA